MRYRDIFWSVFMLSSLVLSACSSSGGDDKETLPTEPIVPTPTESVDICEVSVDTIRVMREGGNVSFVTSTNLQFTISTAEEWITIVSDGRAAPSFAEYVAQLSVAENIGKEREGVVIVKFDDSVDQIEKEIVVIQEGAQEVEMATTDVKGVWSGSDGATYYFYINKKIYVVDDNVIEMGDWDYIPDEKIMVIGESQSQVVYSENPDTIRFEAGLILTRIDESLPDESNFIVAEKEIIGAIEGMSGITWVPEEV